MVKEMKEEKLSYEIPEIKDLTMVDSLLGASGFGDGDGGEEEVLDTEEEENF